MTFGVCIVALGYDIYGSYALNLAISLKVYQPDIKIALLCEPSTINHFTDEEKSVFTSIINIPESDYLIGGVKQYQRVKLCVNKYTPFEYTFYMDADNIFLDKKVNWLFGELHSRDFYIGCNGFYDYATNKKSKNNYTYWTEDIRETCKYHKISFLPQTVSGFYYFKKNDWTDDLFRIALEVYDDPKALTVKWANGKPDEYCFNVALAKKNFKQREFHVFYFDKLNGSLEAKDIYTNFWGIATGGNRVSKNLIIIYNRLVDKYCTKLGISTRRYHVNKCDVVPERKLM